MPGLELVHIGLRPAPRPLPPVEDDAQDLAPDEPEPDDALGTVISIPLWKSRETLLAAWQAIGDATIVDRGWGQIPASPGECLFEPRFITAALDKTLSLEAARQAARQGRWAMLTGVDLAGSSSAAADFFVAVTIAVNPETDHRYVVDLQRGKGLSLTEQVRLIRATDQAFEPLFRIEANGPAFTHARHLKNQVRHAELVFTTARSKWSPTTGLPVLVAEFGSGLWRIPSGDARSRRLLTPLVDELRAFPRGRHDDTVMALSFASAAAVEVAQRPRPKRIGVDWIAY